MQILTLEPWHAMYFLLRLEHVLEKYEDPKLSQPVTVDLKGLFSPFEIVSIKETTLGANQWLEDNHRLRFEKGLGLEQMLVEQYESDAAFYYTTADKYFFGLNDSNLPEDISKLKGLRQSQDVNDVYDDDVISNQIKGNSFEILLNPMQIRTFVIDVQRK